jgi:hypothetical protein
LTLSIADLDALHELASAAGQPPKSGGHSLYFVPATLQHPLLREFFAIYPAGVGLKVLRNTGSPEVANFLTAGSHSSLRNRVIGRLDHHARAANYLWTRGLAPRIWDVVELRFVRATHSALVVENVEGTPASPQAQNEFLASLATTLALGVVDIAVEDWKSHYDFIGKGLEGNLVVAGERACYVDTQNFFLVSPSAWTEEIIGRAANTLHFGDRRHGERLLYQSIPGLTGRAKRDVASRFVRYQDELSRRSLELRGRIVMDVGCNSGMMMHAALTAGAEWAFGWDRPQVAPLARELLLSLGMTRFDVTGKQLSAEIALRSDVPDRFRPSMPEALIFYLAIHGHIGVNEDLFGGPWRAAVLEGHQGETSEDRDRVIGRIRSLAGEIDVNVFEIGDADSLPRWAAIAVRR